jgi:ferredoxin
MAELEIKIDRERCFGSGECVMSAPAIFDIGDDDTSTVVTDGPPWPVPDQLLREIASHCPSHAISLVALP